MEQKIVMTNQSSVMLEMQGRVVGWTVHNSAKSTKDSALLPARRHWSTGAPGQGLLVPRGSGRGPRVGAVSLSARADSGVHGCSCNSRVPRLHHLPQAQAAINEQVLLGSTYRHHQPPLHVLRDTSRHGDIPSDTGTRSDTHYQLAPLPSLPAPPPLSHTQPAPSPSLSRIAERLPLPILRLPFGPEWRCRPHLTATTTMTTTAIARPAWPKLLALVARQNLIASSPASSASSARSSATASFPAQTAPALVLSVCRPPSCLAKGDAASPSVSCSTACATTSSCSGVITSPLSLFTSLSRHSAKAPTQAAVTMIATMTMVHRRRRSRSRRVLVTSQTRTTRPSMYSQCPSLSWLARLLTL